MKTTHGQDPRPLLTVDQFAAYVQAPKNTVYKWNSEGTGPAYVRCGKAVRYRWEDIEAWLLKSRVL